MNYVISDIHGDYDRYKALIEKINLHDEDNLYVLGDVVDRGNRGIDILLDMMSRPNVLPILGNHEYMAYSCLKMLAREVTEDSLTEITEDRLQGLLQWMSVGGETTIKEFHALTPQQRQDITEYMEEFSAYEVVKTGNRVFILVHAGLDNFSQDRLLRDYDISELIFKSPDYNKEYYKNAYLVTGHLPTREIRARLQGRHAEDMEPDELSDEILKMNGHIAIDCGCGFGGKLGCICLDTLEEFYV